MKLYLAGPMRGYPNFNFPAFHRAAALLREAGHEVFSPAEHGVALFGELGENPEGCEGVFAKQVGMTELELRRKIFGEDMAWICAHAEGIALLPGWEKSKGACAEHATAIALGLEVLLLEPMALAAPVTLQSKEAA